MIMISNIGAIIMIILMIIMMIRIYRARFSK